MNRAPLEQVIADARQEIELILVELRRIEALERRLRTLEQFVLTAEQLSRESSPVGSRMGLIGVAEVARDARAETGSIMPTERLWEAVQLIMQVRKKPMTPTEVLEALEAEKFRVQGEHKRETVRSAMSRKPEVFEKVKRGLYALKGWSDDTKLSRQAELIDSDEAESDSEESVA